MNSAEEVIVADLDYIVEKAGDELTRLAGKSVLITGGAGFLGYYLVQSVLHWNRRVSAEKKIRITVFDNYIRGRAGWIEAFGDSGALRLVQHDVARPLPEDVDDFQFIIHAASIASPTFYRRHPIETMDANVYGLRYLLDYCLRQKECGRAVEGFLFFSSSEIYGDPTPGNIPTPETYPGNVSCTGPRACYDESKRFGETLCVNFARVHGLPVRIVRPFNNYGPGLRLDDKRVIPDFARDVLNGDDIVIHSDGSPRRTFCYIADAVTGYYKALVNGRDGRAYNIGTDCPEISVAELAEKIGCLAAELFGYAGGIVHKGSRDSDYLTDNPQRRCPDITRARTELGYSPGIGLDEGLRRSLLWYAGNFKAEAI